jgi:CDP-diacylglycerol--glycerol-3-phosphate 3-phosphatidyltransferase
MKRFSLCRWPAQRKFSTSNFVQKLLSYHRQHSPAFVVDPGSIEVLRSPAQFYLRILELVSQSEKRVLLSSLYLGTGELERKLVAELVQRKHAQPHLHISFLLDYRRGTRVEKNDTSVGVLDPLLSTSSASLHLFKVPETGELWDSVLRGRARELLGVHHMKM